MSIVITIHIPELAELRPVFTAILDTIAGQSQQLLAVRSDLTEMRSQMGTIQKEVEDMGTTAQNFGQQELALLDKLNEATNGIASRIQSIVDNDVAKALAGAGVDPGTQQQILTKIQSEIDALNAIGADPANPVPPAATGGTAATGTDSGSTSSGATDASGSSVSAPGGQVAEPTI